MRIITLSALFLFSSLTLAAPLDYSARQEDTYSGLALRDGVADTKSAIGITDRSDFDDENWLERRNRAKKTANRLARKERKTAAKNLVASARIDAEAAFHPDQQHTAAAHAAGLTALRNKKQELRNAAQYKHHRMKAAGVQHRMTTGLPDRTHKYIVPAGNNKPERTYTGKDVRQANFGSHIMSPTSLGAGPNPSGIHVNIPGRVFGKPFRNDDHIHPGSSGTVKPLPSLVGEGHEHPLSGATDRDGMRADHKKQPARIISQPTENGHQHIGVIAHDQSRTKSHPGRNDHFQITPIPMPHPSPIYEIPDWM